MTGRRCSICGLTAVRLYRQISGPGTGYKNTLARQYDPRTRWCHICLPASIKHEEISESDYE